MADLNVLIRERINIEGTERGTDYNLTLTEINYIDNRIINCPTGSTTTIATFGSLPGAGQFITSSLKYARITNYSSTNQCRLKIRNDQEENSSFIIAPKGSFYLSSINQSGDSSSFPIITETITSLEIIPSGSDVKIEYFIATT
jgi:hypothetical protein